MNENTITALKEAKWILLMVIGILLALTLFVCAVKADKPTEVVDVANAIKGVPAPLIEAIK